MTAAFDPTAVSSLAQEIAEHVGPLEAVPPAHLPLWLPDLAPPPNWTALAVDGANVTRLLLRALSSDAHWDGCEIVNLYRIPATVPEAVVVDNADRTLRDSGATDIRSYPLDVPRGYGVIATHAVGVLRSGDRIVRSQFRNYVVNTAAGGALIEQAIVIGADMLFALESEATELTESLYRSLLASIERALNMRQV